MDCWFDKYPIRIGFEVNTCTERGGAYTKYDGYGIFVETLYFDLLKYSTGIHQID